MDDSENQLRQSNTVEVEVYQDANSKERVFRTIKIGDVASRADELFNEQVDGKETVFSNYQKLLNTITKEEISQIRENSRALAAELKNFSNRVTEGLTRAHRQAFNSPLRVLGGIMSHDMINHSVNDFAYTLTFLDFDLEYATDPNGVKEILIDYEGQIKEHMRAMQTFFASFEKLMRGESVTLKDVIESFPKIKGTNMVFEINDVEIENGGDGSDIEVHTLYGFADIRTILLNGMEAKSKQNISPRGYKEVERIMESPILVRYEETEQSIKYTITDDTPTYKSKEGENVVAWFMTEEKREDYIRDTGDKKIPPSMDRLNKIYRETDINYIGTESSGGLELIAANLKVIGGKIELKNSDDGFTKSVELTFPKTSPSSNPNPTV